VRSRELRAALDELGEGIRLVELAFSDGRTDEHREAITAALREALPEGACIVAPWRGDAHRDHRVVGELCAEIARERDQALLEYPIWMWHWSHPRDDSVPWSAACSLHLTEGAVTAKRAAVSRYQTQTSEVRGRPALLTESFLENFSGKRELFFTTAGESPGALPESYFDGLYERNDDPWRLSTRWYESRKRAITVASLPRERFGSALEIGCSVGELTALLAERTGALVALDISQAAVDRAAARTRGLDNVIIQHRDATRDFPPGPFDLIVLSEVGYYWELPVLRTTVRSIVRSLSDDGVLVACHWRHAVADYPLGGDEVHRVLAEIPGLHRTARHEEADFLLEVFGTSEDSVGRREGLA